MLCVSLDVHRAVAYGNGFSTVQLSRTTIELQRAARGTTNGQGNGLKPTHAVLIYRKQCFTFCPPSHDTFKTIQSRARPRPGASEDSFGAPARSYGHRQGPTTRPMPSKLASPSSLPTGASVGAIHASSRRKKLAGEEVGSPHPCPGSRNADSVSSPGELDPFVDPNEWRRARPVVGPALSDRASCASSRVTVSSAGVDNSDAESSNEPHGYAPFVPRAAVTRATERSGGGHGRDGSRGIGNGGGRGSGSDWDVSSATRWGGYDELPGRWVGCCRESGNDRIVTRQRYLVNSSSRYIKSGSCSSRRVASGEAADKAAYYVY